MTDHAQRDEQFIIPFAAAPATWRLFARAASIYGVTAQRLKLIEELSELSAALMRDHLGGVPLPDDHLAGEVADVIILLTQLLHNDPKLNDATYARVTAKLERFAARVAVRETMTRG